MQNPGRFGAAVALAICAGHRSANALAHPADWSLASQSIVGDQVAVYDTDVLPAPPYAVSRRVSLSAGATSTSTASLADGTLQATVTGYAPNIEAYANFSDALTVAGLNPATQNYVDLTVTVPGPVLSPDGDANCGVDLYATEPNNNISHLQADLRTDGMDIGTRMGIWPVMGQGVSRVFTTRLPLGAYASTQIMVQFSVFGQSPAVGDSFDLSPQVSISLPIGATLASASGSFLANASSRITYH